MKHTRENISLTFVSMANRRMQSYLVLGEILSVCDVHRRIHSSGAVPGESRSGRPGLSVLTSLLVSVEVKLLLMMMMS